MQIATERLYAQDVYLKSAEMKLLELREDGGGLKAAFDRTVFFPEGGGQPCDLGTIGGMQVTDVQEDKETGVIWHTLGGSAQPAPACGGTYTGILDWERRRRNMQMHCGEHLISGAFYKLYGVANKGFHMGDDYVTIDLDLPQGSEYKEITAEMEAGAERLANLWVWEDLPVSTIFFDTPEEAMRLPCRKAIKAKEDVSVILVGSEDDPADCCACCGTHPASTGMIGLIKLTHCERYKGMNRYYVKIGEPAYRDYREAHGLLDALGRRFSCDPAGIPKALDAEEARASETRARFAEFKAWVLEKAEADIRASLGEPSSAGARIFRHGLLGADDLQALGRKFESELKGLLILVSEKEHSAVLASSGAPDCGKLVKEYAAMYHGKGGGRPQSARAMFPGAEDLELFADLIEKHLR